MALHRRHVLKGLAATSALTGIAPNARAHRATSAALKQRVRPGEPGWPTESAWRELGQSLEGRLMAVTSPLEACEHLPNGAACDAALADLANPLFIQDQPGATQSAGWVEGWTSTPSVYAVEVASAADVATAVTFAREHNLRLVIKGGAHSYLGQSNCADSLMIWTRRLDAIELHDSFVPTDCRGTIVPQPAVSVGSGAKFYQLYDAVTTKAGRYVQGGGCTTVGLGGHVQTGGFGSFSKYGGLVAANLLEAEIVTADGTIRIANACTHPDLFKALKGGGAGFGVTTKLTLATRDLPTEAGFLGQTIKATSDQAFRDLVTTLCAFVPEALINPHWGEQVTFGPDNSLTFALVWQGLSETEVRDTWAPFWAWITARADTITAEPPRLVSLPLRHWWDFAYRQANLPDSIVADPRPDAPPGGFWWKGNGSEVGIFISGYESVWLPDTLLRPEDQTTLADALVRASRHFATTLHFNKGLAGATEARRAEARTTTVHPSAIDAFALAIIAGGQQQAYPGVPGHEPDRTAAARERDAIHAAYRELRRIAPKTGSYSSEMSFFEPDWQQTAWGPHYPALLKTKEKYDPQGLFTGHHQVGSEFWSADGFTRLG